MMIIIAFGLICGGVISACADLVFDISIPLITGGVWIAGGAVSSVALRQFLKRISDENKNRTSQLSECFDAVNGVAALVEKMSKDISDKSEITALRNEITAKLSELNTSVTDFSALTERLDKEMAESVHSDLEALRESNALILNEKADGVNEVLEDISDFVEKISVSAFQVLDMTDKIASKLPECYVIEDIQSDVSKIASAKKQLSENTDSLRILSDEIRDYNEIYHKNIELVCKRIEQVTTLLIDSYKMLKQAGDNYT